MRSQIAATGKTLRSLPSGEVGQSFRERPGLQDALAGVSAGRRRAGGLDAPGSGNGGDQMAAEPSQIPSFSRGSAVLEYWLVHAEGLVVQPLGARVEHVVVAVSAGRADSLIVRSRLIHRRKTIPAAAIAAVEPATGRLLLDTEQETRSVRTLRWTGAATVVASRRTRAATAVALRRTRAASATLLAWLRPRVVAGGAAVASYTRLVAALDRAGDRVARPAHRRRPRSAWAADKTRRRPGCRRREGITRSTPRRPGTPPRCFAERPVAANSLTPLSRVVLRLSV